MSPAAAYALAAVIAPAAAALALALLPRLRRAGTPAAMLCLAGTGGSFACALAALSRVAHTRSVETSAVPWLQAAGRPVVEVGVHVDGVSAPMLAVVTLVALCVQVFSLGYMRDEPRAAFGRYFAFHALFLFSMNVLVVSPNLLQLFAGWELVGLASYLLIGFYHRKPAAARAAVKAFWVTRFADMGFVFGLLALYTASGAFGWGARLDPAAATLVTLMLFVAVMGKSAQFPLHVWLPDAMEGPTPVSALLHAATMVAAGVFLVVRASPLFAQSEATRAVMLVTGSFTALFAALLALAQTDIKKVLAYSTCSQLGYMVAALGAGSVFAGFFHLTTHAFFKALLFLAAGSVIHAVHSNEMGAMGGLARRMPLTAGAFVTGALALAGAPGLAGFFSKDLVLESVEGRLGGLPSLALLATAFLTAFYMGRVVFVTFFGTPSTDHAARAHEHGWSMRGPLVALAALSVAAGYFGADLARLSGHEYRFHFGGGGVLATGLGLAGATLAYAVYGRGPRGAPAAVAAIERAARSRAVDRAYEFAFGRVTLAAAGALAWVDRYVVDGIINLAGYVTLRLGQRARRLQTGEAPDYVLAVMLGAAAMAAWGVLQ